MKQSKIVKALARLKERDEQSREQGTYGRHVEDHGREAVEAERVSTQPASSRYSDRSGPSDVSVVASEPVGSDAVYVEPVSRSRDDLPTLQEPALTNEYPDPTVHADEDDERVPAPPSVSDPEPVAKGIERGLERAISAVQSQLPQEPYVEAEIEVTAHDTGAADEEPPRDASLVSIYAEQDGPERIVDIASAIARNGATESTTIGNRQLTEELRRIKRPLLRNIANADADVSPYRNIVVVTSSVQGEGKTFVSLNLALSIASERDVNVVLIDGDLQRAELSRTVGLAGRSGLIDYIEGDDVGFSAILYHTDRPNMRFVPAGEPAEHSSELLSSKKMEKLAVELSSRYADRVIVIDAPPLLASNAAAVLSAISYQSLLVVAAESTLQDHIKTSLNQLKDADIVGVVLNKLRNRFNAGSSGDHYYNYS